MSGKSNTKLLLIGWDGADWRLLKPLMDKGLMPALSRLVGQGFSGKLASCEPMISPILWTSIATGVRAYQHGIHGFIEARPEGDGVRPIRASQRNVPAIWNILNAHQKRTHVVGWWPSYPAERVQGVMVSNFFAMPDHHKAHSWPLMQDAVHPAELEETLSSLQVHPTELTDQILRPFFPDAGILEPTDAVLQSVAKILAQTLSVHNAITYALEEHPWDFAAVYYNSFDHFLHLANRFHPPQMEEISDADFQKYHYIITAACRFYDMMLERLMDLAGPDAHIFLVSDHGFDTDQQRKPFLPLTPGAPALEHQPYGIVAGMGPNWKSGQQIFGASLLDVAPTILALFDAPIGKYMEGRIWEEIFRQTIHTEIIEAYKYAPTYAHPGAVANGPDAVDLMQQLESLGYVTPSQNDNNTPNAALLENQFYLAGAYLDGRKYAKAIEVLEEILDQAPLVPRYCFLMLHAAIQAGDTPTFLNTMRRLEQSNLATDPRMLYYQGLWHLHQRAYLKAFDVFEQLLQKQADKPVLLYQAGRALLEAGMPVRALPYLEKAVALRPDHAASWMGLGEVYLKSEDYEQALNCYFEAIELNYALPEAHHKAGQILAQLGDLVAARLAFEVALSFDGQNIEILQGLANLYEELQMEPEAHQTKVRLQALENPIVVVSGLPRSGTSLCMQMLEAGGFPVFSDGQRTKDVHNPQGYLEHEAVKSLAVDARFLENARGKAIKIVAPLVEKIPAQYPYKIIFVQRPVAEVVLSQEKMRGVAPEKLAQAFPFELAMKLELAKEDTLAALHSRKHIQILELHYHDLLRQPETAAAAITKFLQKDLDTTAMAAAVNQNSYRTRLNRNDN